MITSPVCPECRGPGIRGARRCLKCAVLEWYRVVPGVLGLDGDHAALDQDCRVRVFFNDKGLALSYRCNRAAAYAFVNDAVPRNVFDRIAIDDKVTPDLRRLPCENSYALV